MLFMFPLLLELLGKCRELSPAATFQRTQLVVNHDVVYPFRVGQQVFEVLQLLLDPGGASLLLTNPFLQTVLLLPERRELLLEFGPIPVQVEAVPATSKPGVIG